MMTCDNDCTRAGWVEAVIEGDGYNLHISHDPTVDLDGSFQAFCHDEQELIRINGWMISDYQLVD